MLLAAPLARPYLAAQAVKGDRDEGSIRVYSAGPSDYFRAHPRSATYGGRLLADRYPERALFPGTLPLALSAVALVPPVGAIRLAYAAGLVAAFDLSLGFNGVTYKHLYRWFLPIRGLRVPARMSIVLAISLAVLAAFGARRLLARFRTAAGRTVVFGAMVLACCRGRLAGSRAAPRLVAAATDLRRARRPGRRPGRIPDAPQHQPRHQRRALHVSSRSGTGCR